ncbi:hypothetical protein ACQPYH_28215 [Kribbella sp. CA-245084]|uniref:hypothetical protein n=1 Tax=Kribbella sp. CA-245084 TaxID=3239940 RepID=UPI003D93B974
MTCDRTVPSELTIHFEPREPVSDPTLGIAVPRGAPAKAAHRLVTLGDSLTEGFMSAAVFRTDQSWPAITAYELGLTATEFRFPTYETASGPGGLPLDLERLTRAFQRRFGDRLDFWEYVTAALWLRDYMDGVEDYWERGPGSGPSSVRAPFHNMAVYGWDLLDTQMLTADLVAARIGTPRDDLLNQIVQNSADRAAWPVLQAARDSGRARTVLDAAATLGTSDGIETMVVMLGANNCLGSVVGLQPCWTAANYLDLEPAARLEAKRGCNVWRPQHFEAEWATLVERLRAVEAQHVIVATVPSVTIAPIARGVVGKIDLKSRYFPYYTRPWITDEAFDPARDPHITADEARAVDSAIDSYNETIVASVEAARHDGLDWYVFDLAGLLDGLATRRYIESPWARPPWWKPYELPEALHNLDPVPSTRFFRAGPHGRTDGGLFSLDGVHPTTISYGLIAQEVIKIMQLAGVQFRTRDGQPRNGSVSVDFERLLQSDTLISNPPAVISPTLSMLGWLNEQLDWVQRLLPFMPAPS